MRVSFAVSCVFCAFGRLACVRVRWDVPSRVLMFCMSQCLRHDVRVSARVCVCALACARACERGCLCV